RQCRAGVVALEAVLLERIMLEEGRLPGARVQNEETQSVRQPHLTVPVLIDVEHNDVGDIQLRHAQAVVDEALGVGTKPVERLVCSNPKRSCAVLEQGEDVVPAQAACYAGVMSEYLEFVAVVSIQAILGAEPNETVIILNDLLGACL